MTKRYGILTAPALLLFLPAFASAWDAGGHLLVDEIALQRLKPGVAEKIEALLPSLDARFNHGNPYDFITAGLWMDDMRGLGRDYRWGKWHYIDFPCSAVADFAAPKAPHILWAIAQAEAAIKDPASTPEARAIAVAQLIHLVGDIHQPLHASTRDDHGGTSTLIEPVAPEEAHGWRARKPMTLHAFWDGAYRFAKVNGSVAELWQIPSIADRPANSHDAGIVGVQAEALLAKFPPAKLAPLSGPGAANPETWAQESHALGCKCGWPADFKASDYEVLRLTPEFVQTANEVAAERIVLAGCRLAQLLNTLFAEPVTAP